MAARGERAALASRPPGAEPRAQRLPDFFIVGQPKCGTTALVEILRRHPQVFVPQNKEPWFFAEELHERTPPRPEGTPKTLEEYSALFEPATPEQRAGEATVLYLWSRTAAQAIAAVQPDARIIAIVREPASFLRSLHLQFLQAHVETEPDLRRALALEDERRQGRAIPRQSYWPATLMYSEHVRYVEQLRRFYDVFAPEQILVLVYDDFRADNEAVARQVLRFLDVDDTVAIESGEVNPTVQPRSQRLHELLGSVVLGRGMGPRAVKTVVKSLTPAGLRRRALQATQRRLVFAAPPPPDEGLMRELRVRYAGEVRALSEFLGRDLVGEWGYDGLL
jgi:Sulfotransferase domain